MTGLDPKSDIIVGAETISHIAPTDFPNNDFGVAAQSWSFEKFMDGLSVDIKRLADEEIEFDIIGVDASIANALRRTLIADIQTVAIEKVFIGMNTSLVQDEVLAQRLGLVPIRFDPHELESKSAEDAADASNTLVFHLNVGCQAKRATERLTFEQRFNMNPEDLYINHSVYSGDLAWVPQADQADRWIANPPAPVHDDILLAKLRPGQRIECEVQCYKGQGREHAKWSPVARASYRLLPLIHVARSLKNEDVPLFRSCFPAGVVGFHPDPNAPDSHSVVDILNARRDTMSREVLRHPQFADIVTLGRRRDHFIFNVESTGQFKPERLMAEASAELLAKIREIRLAVSALQRR